MKLGSILIVVLFLSAIPASASEGIRLGSETASRECSALSGTGRCRFTATPTAQLKVRTTNSKAAATYRFRIPSGQEIQAVRIGWYEPSKSIPCLGTRKTVERSGRRVVVTATTRSRGRSSLCGIDAVIVRYR